MVELLLQTLKSRNRVPSAKGYRSKGFNAFAVGPGVIGVDRENLCAFQHLGESRLERDLRVHRNEVDLVLRKEPLHGR